MRNLGDRSRLLPSWTARLPNPKASTANTIFTIATCTRARRTTSSRPLQLKDYSRANVALAEVDAPARPTGSTNSSRQHVSLPWLQECLFRVPGCATHVVQPKWQVGHGSDEPLGGWGRPGLLAASSAPRQATLVGFPSKPRKLEFINDVSITNGFFFKKGRMFRMLFVSKKETHTKRLILTMYSIRSFFTKRLILTIYYIRSFLFIVV